MIRTDIVVIGAGIAGASLAAELSPHAAVVLVEAEATPGYHATGRSAAFWNETYGGPAVQPLTSASGAWLRRPPEGFSVDGYLRPRGALHLADAAGRGALERLVAAFAGRGVALERLGRPDIEAILPGIRPGRDWGLLEPSCSDIDVATLHGDWLRVARQRGATMVTQAPVDALVRSGDHWRVRTTAGEIAARIVVNAAGAWADPVARLAGAAPLGIRPYRRTVSQVTIEPSAPSTLPLVIDAAGAFYFKPEAGGRLWLSPHDETPSDACDAAPEELDVARAIDRLQRAVDWRVIRVERSWAGLRSFAPDRAPIYGFDDRVPGFFWFAGQGGFGIQTAPAAAMVAASVLLGYPLAPPVAAIDAARYAPARFAS